MEGADREREREQRGEVGKQKDREKVGERERERKNQAVKEREICEICFLNANQQKCHLSCCRCI